MPQKINANKRKKKKKKKIPWTEEPGRLQSMGSQSQTRLSDFTSGFSLVVARGDYSLLAVQGMGFSLQQTLLL